MMAPVRCFSCGKVIGHLFEEFKRRIEEGEEPKKVFEELGLRRYCCRQVLMSSVEVIDEVMKFKP